MTLRPGLVPDASVARSRGVLPLTFSPHALCSNTRSPMILAPAARPAATLQVMIMTGLYRNNSPFPLGAGVPVGACPARSSPGGESGGGA
ncbi:hypothetical protein DSECCO2_288770 [anaerobic digester metagenome]